MHLNWFIQKQPPEMFYKNMCSKKSRKIHRKTHLNKVAGFKSTFFAEHLRVTASVYYKKQHLNTIPYLMTFCKISDIVLRP